MERKHGGNIYAAARQAGLDPEEIIDFSASINPTGLSPRFKKKFYSLEHSILNYPDRDARAYIEALSAYHQLPEEYFLTGNGSTEFIYLLPDIIRPKSVLITAPAFTEYESSYQRAKGVIFYFTAKEKDGFALQESRLCNELKRGYSALYICNPATPTGTLTSLATMEKIIAAAAPKSTLVIADETFIDFAEDHSCKTLVKKFDNLHVLRSMTKFFGLPGLRSGYVISNNKNIERLREKQQPWSTNAVAQLAGIESLQDTGYIQKTLQYVKDAKKAFIAELKKISSFKLYPGVANFILIKLSDAAPVTPSQLYEQLLQKGILIRTCEDFKGLDDTFIRIAVKKKNENKKFITEVKKILGKKKS